MIEARKTTQEDIKEMLANGLDYGKVDWATLGPEAITVTDDGEILCVGGIHWYWPKVGEAWVALHKNAMKKGYKFFRATKEIFSKLLEVEDWHRVQACVRANWPEAVKIVETLGFEREAKLRKYCDDGSDAYLYAMVR